VRLRDLSLSDGQDCGMLAVMEGSRAGAADAHAAWSESFNELFVSALTLFGSGDDHVTPV
jgi:hypothetical protein